MHHSPPSLPQRGASAARLRLRILCTTDLHAHVMPWDYVTDAPACVGLAQLAPLIRKLRAEQPNCLLLDNGDFLQGSPLGEWHARFGSSVHPMIAAMNALGYEAGTLGNHEFSHGLPYLERAIADAHHPVVSANLARSDGRALVPPYVILNRDLTDLGGNTCRLRIAVTGFAPPQTTRWEALRLQGTVESFDMLQSASAVMDQIAVHRPDITIALAHTGIGSSEALAEMENAAVPLALQTGIDVLVTGHTHLVFPDGQQTAEDGSIDRHEGTLCGKPAVMAGFHGSHLGLIDLELEHSGPRWRIASHRVRTLQAPSAPAPDRALARIVKPAHRAALASLGKPLGHSSRPLHSHFALVAPCAPLRLVAMAQRSYWQARLPASVAHLPLLVAVAPFRTGGRGGPRNYTDIPAGPLLARHVADLYSHPNTPVLLSLSGTEVTDWLERAAALFHQITPKARDAPLIRSDVPGFDFDMIDGLSFRIDLSQPPRFDPKGVLLDASAHRVIRLALNNAPLAPDGRYLLATNSYRAGGGLYPGTARQPVAQGDTPIADLVATYASTAGTLAVTAGNDWGFLPLPDTTAILETGPSAADYISDIAHFRPKALGLTDAGFLRFRLLL